MTKTQSLSYRKTQQGEWVVFGPAASLHLGQVTVVKRDGTTKTEHVARLGREFAVDGVRCCYGYLGERLTPEQRPENHRGGPCDNCGSGAGRFPRRDSSGLPGMVCSTCSHEPSYALSFA